MLKRYFIHAQDLWINLGSIVDVIGKTYMIIWRNKNIIHFDYELCVDKKPYEENDGKLSLHLLSVSLQSPILKPSRSELTI